MHRSSNQSLLWLAILIILLIGSSISIVLGISTTLPLCLNILAVTGIVGGALLLSLFKRIQDSEYAYPMWCVVAIIIVASIGAQFIFKYQHVLSLLIMGENGYLYFVERPIQVYFTVLWHLLSVALTLLWIWILLRVTKRFVVFGFYDLTMFPVLFAFFILTLGLDSFYPAPILFPLGIETATFLQQESNAQWLAWGLFALLLVIKLVMAMLYRHRWIVDVKKLIAVALSIWVLISLTNDFLTMFCHQLVNYVTVAGALVFYYLFITMITWVSFKLFFPHKPVREDE